MTERRKSDGNTDGKTDWLTGNWRIDGETEWRMENTENWRNVKTDGKKSIGSELEDG